MVNSAAYFLQIIMHGLKICIIPLEVPHIHSDSALLKMY